MAGLGGVRAGVQQCLADLPMSAASGLHERCLPVHVAAVRVGPGRQQRADGSRDHLSTATVEPATAAIAEEAGESDRQEEGRFAEGIPIIRAATPSQQHIHHLCPSSVEGGAGET